MFPNANEPANEASPNTEGQPNGQEQTHSVPITREEFQAGLKQFEQALQEKLSKQYQGVQSQTDRFTNNVTKQLGSFEQTLRDLQARGIVNMSEAQIKQAVREDALDRVIAGQVQPTGQVGNTNPTQSGNVIADMVNAAADRISKRYEVTIDDSDPEVTQFKLAELSQSPNYEDYLLGFEKATAAKAARLKQQGVARSPGIIQHTPDTSNPLEGVTDLSAIWSQTSLGKLRG